MNDRKNTLLGKIVVVTGASSGIGKAIAIHLAQLGSKVILSSRNLQRCEEVAAEISINGGTADPIVCDVRDEKATENLFEYVKQRWGIPDIVVANAGIPGGSKKLIEYEKARWDELVATNLTGCFLTVREAARHMVVHSEEKRRRSIFVISSLAGTRGFSKKVPYCAVKFAVRGMALALSEELRSSGISVCSICPGSVDTPILAASGANPKRPMSPKTVAEAVGFIAAMDDNVMVRDLILERMIEV